MKIQGEYTFETPRELVWEGLQDPEVLASVLPGCEKLELVGENAYEGALKIKVGPVQGKFKGKIQLEDIQDLEGYTMKVDGRGAPGFVRATGKVKLGDQGEGTHMAYEADAQVGGRIASVGQRLLDSSAKAIINQSLEGLHQTLKNRFAQNQQGSDPAANSADGDGAGNGAAAQEPLPPPAAPSQTDFAVGVAKEVAKDLIPPSMRPVAIVAGAAIIALLAYLTLG